MARGGFPARTDAIDDIGQTASRIFKVQHRFAHDYSLPKCRSAVAASHTDEKLVRREGAGRRLNPFRYRLPNEDDEYRDRGELPPLRDLEEAWGSR
jgi:hypothetical protein